MDEAKHCFFHKLYATIDNNLVTNMYQAKVLDHKNKIIGLNVMSAISVWLARRGAKG